MSSSYDPHCPLSKQTTLPSSPPYTPPDAHPSTSSSSSSSQSHLGSNWNSYNSMSDPSSSSSSTSPAPPPRSPHKEGGRYLPPSSQSTGGGGGMLFDEGGPAQPPSDTTLTQDQEDKDGHFSSHSHPSSNPIRSSSYINEKSTAPSASASAQAPLKIPTSRQAYNAPRTPGDLDSDLAQFPRDKESFQQGPSYHPLTGNNPNTTTPPPSGGKKEFKDSEAYWLGLYFFFNLGLTLFNKIVLVSFPFPYVSFPHQPSLSYLLISIALYLSLPPIRCWEG